MGTAIAAIVLGATPPVAARTVAAKMIALAKDPTPGARILESHEL